MKTRGKMAVSVCLAMVIAAANLAACGTTKSSSDSSTAETIADENLDYTYGEHFHSDTPVDYSMMFSDNEAYPYNDSWMLFNEITKESNVTLDFADYTIARTDYDQKKALLINSGKAAYIIPKTYDESAVVTGGAIVPISDWTQYMPNYTAFVEKYNLQSDLDTLRQEDGKYYRLPGLHDTALQDYSFVVRNDIFKAAGIDVSKQEENWNWDDFYNDMVKVKAYMVSQGMCSDSDYIWTERWPGDDGSGGNLLKLMGASYGVNAGWAIGSGMVYNQDTKQYEFCCTSDSYKEFLTELNKFIAGGILNPESFTMTDEQATQKFYSGKSVVMGENPNSLVETQKKLASTLGNTDFELYKIVCPKGNCDYNAETTRLENGIMISQRALDELGTQGFIKMLRFIDWLWYSDEGKTLTKWGIKGVTYNEVADASTGTTKKVLTDGYYGNGVQKTSDSQQYLNSATGFGCGVFVYAGTTAQVTDAYSAMDQDFIKRNQTYRKCKATNPRFSPSEDESEQISLYKTPLVDNVNSWSLKFATGQKNINSDWNEYIKSCENLNCSQLTALYNEINQKNNK